MRFIGSLVSALFLFLAIGCSGSSSSTPSIQKPVDGTAEAKKLAREVAAVSDTVHELLTSPVVAEDVTNLMADITMNLGDANSLLGAAGVAYSAVLDVLYQDGLIDNSDGTYRYAPESIQAHYPSIDQLPNVVEFLDGSNSINVTAVSGGLSYDSVSRTFEFSNLLVTTSQHSTTVTGKVQLPVPGTALSEFALTFVSLNVVNADSNLTSQAAPVGMLSIKTSNDSLNTDALPEDLLRSNEPEFRLELNEIHLDLPDLDFTGEINAAFQQWVGYSDIYRALEDMKFQGEWQTSDGTMEAGLSYFQTPNDTEYDTGESLIPDVLATIDTSLYEPPVIVSYDGSVFTASLAGELTSEFDRISGNMNLGVRRCYYNENTYSDDNCFTATEYRLEMAGHDCNDQLALRESFSGADGSHVSEMCVYEASLGDYLQYHGRPDIRFSRVEYFDSGETTFWYDLSVKYSFRVSNDGNPSVWQESSKDVGDSGCAFGCLQNGLSLINLSLNAGIEIPGSFERVDVEVGLTLPNLILRHYKYVLLSDCIDDLINPFSIYEDSYWFCSEGDFDYSFVNGDLSFDINHRGKHIAIDWTNLNRDAKLTSNNAPLAVMNFDLLSRTEVMGVIEANNKVEANIIVGSDTVYADFPDENIILFNQ